MHTSASSFAVCCILALFLAATAFSADSGTLWYRYAACPDSYLYPQLLLDAAAPLTITVTARPLRGPGTLDLSVVDLYGMTVFARHFDFAEGFTTTTITTPPLAAGTYFLKPVGSFYDFFRFSVSAERFVWPSCIDFMGETPEGLDAQGSYYFYVPEGTATFTFRLQVPDPEHGGATIVAPDGSVRATFDLYGPADQSQNISVPESSAGSFWRVDLINEYADIRFYLTGVPPFFASTPGAWFEPAPRQFHEPVCGDQDGDGELAPTDVMYLINHLFAGGPAPANCPPVRTVNAETARQSSGFYDLFDLSVVDPDLAPDNIRSGVSVFGVAGNPNVVNTSTGTATAADIALGKKAWVMGSEITGAAPSAGAPAPVATTGQSICFDATGVTANEIACTGTGQDGEKRKGAPWPNPRFSDNGNGAVTDNLTGLVWLKNANCFGPAMWADALADANALASGACGLTDGSVAGNWRLPNVRELQSLLSYDHWAPALANAAGTGRWSEGDAFVSVGTTSSYWSSTTYLSYPSHAYVTLFADAITSEADKKVAGPLVWPVRDGQ